MKTARDYLDKEYQNDGDRRDLQFEITLNPSLERLEAAINQARKETIQECAKKAKVIPVPLLALSQQGYSPALSNQMPYSVDKQSILDLIKELK